MKLNRKQFCALFKADFFVVGVKFDQPPAFSRGVAATMADRKTYSYKAPLDTEVEIGDYVYVPDVDSNEVVTPNLKRAQVYSIIKDTDEFAESGVGFKWIIGTQTAILEKYSKSLAQDINVLKAVQKLERAMDRVELQAQMKLAMELLTPAERSELTDSLGLDLSKLTMISGPNKAT